MEGMKCEEVVFIPDMAPHMKHTLTRAERCTIQKANALQARTVKKLAGEKAVKEKVAEKKAVQGKVVKGKTVTGIEKKMPQAKPAMMAL